MYIADYGGSIRLLNIRTGEIRKVLDRLAAPRGLTILDGLISVRANHAPNGLANDGEYVYASIGHPQEWVKPNNLFNANADLFAENGRRPDLMGVIARFRPPDGEVEVFASGLRNTYQISIAPTAQSTERITTSTTTFNGRPLPRRTECHSEGRFLRLSVLGN